MTSVLQKWVQKLNFMQQSVLICAIRGPDGVSRLHPCKNLVKWYRRCVLYSAFASAQPTALLTPCGGGGGSFTGPSCEFAGRTWQDAMESIVQAYIDSRDELPAHYQGHMMHAAEIVGYKHTDPEIRTFWLSVYQRMSMALHLTPETEAQMDFRLGDNKDQWQSVQVETYQGSKT